METRVINIYSDVIPPEGVVSIMRPSMLSNPFRIGADGTREQVMDQFLPYITDRVLLNSIYRNAVKGLLGKTLLCCCKPKACHGDILVTLCEALHKEDDKVLDRQG